MLETQNRRIDDLMERIRLQQEKLDKQNVRIRTLQSQVRKRYNHEDLSASHIRVIAVKYYFVMFSANLIIDSLLFFRSNSRDRDQPRGAATLTAPCKVASRSNATHQSVSKARKASKIPSWHCLKSTGQNLTPNVAGHLFSQAIKTLKSLAIKIKESNQFGTRFSAQRDARNINWWTFCRSCAF